MHNKIIVLGIMFIVLSTIGAVYPKTMIEVTCTETVCCKHVSYGEPIKDEQPKSTIFDDVTVARCSHGKLWG